MEERAAREARQEQHRRDIDAMLQETLAKQVGRSGECVCESRTGRRKTVRVCVVVGGDTEGGRHGGRAQLRACPRPSLVS
jgi:hypothetical protein